MLIGAFGGFYSVPLYALIQKAIRSGSTCPALSLPTTSSIRTTDGWRGRSISMVLLQSGLSIPELFLVIAVLERTRCNAYIYTLLPEFLMRFLAWLAITIVYRDQTNGGLENIPHRSGPAVVVCNHVSYMDPIILAGSVRRPMRFVMWYKIFQMPILNFIFRDDEGDPDRGRPREDQQIMDDAFETVDAELAAGNIVCIFPEGAITRRR